MTPGRQEHRSGLTCIHSSIGLCDQCKADYDEDPLGWYEYGDHPAGIEAFAAVQKEMDEMARRLFAPKPPDPDMAF